MGSVPRPSRPDDHGQRSQVLERSVPSGWQIAQDHARRHPQPQASPRPGSRHFEPSRLEGDDPAAAKKKARDSKDRHVRRHRGELPACRSKEPSIGRFVAPNARASCLNFAISRSARSGAETSPVCLDAIVGENREVIADWPRGFWGSRRRAKRSLSLGYERAPINAGEGLCLASRIIKVMEFGRLRGDTMAAEGRAERGQTESG